MKETPDQIKGRTSIGSADFLARPARRFAAKSDNFFASS